MVGKGRNECVIPSCTHFLHIKNRNVLGWGPGVLLVIHRFGLWLLRILILKREGWGLANQLRFVLRRLQERIRG